MKIKKNDGVLSTSHYYVPFPFHTVSRTPGIPRIETSGSNSFPSVYSSYIHTLSYTTLSNAQPLHTFDISVP